MTAFPAILTPEPSDNEDVVSALETADIFWTKGDTDEALRWLKRAAETASDAGNDMRALAIARSAADLKSVPAAPAASPPAAAEPPSVRMSRPPPPSAVARQAPAAPSSMASGSGEAPARAHTSATPQKAPPPLPPSKARESVAPPAAPHKTPTAAPPAPSATGPSAHPRSASTDRMAAVSVEARPSPARTAPPAAAAPTPAEAPARRAAASPSTLPKEPHRAITPATAYRAVAVFVKPQGRNGEKLEVILAKPGQPVPAGAEPALLVPTRRGGRLLG